MVLKTDSQMLLKTKLYGKSLNLDAQVIVHISEIIISGGGKHALVGFKAFR